MTLEEVLTQVLASDDEDSDIEIESEDSYDEQEDSQTDNGQCSENSDEEKLVSRYPVLDVDGPHPDHLDDAPLDNQEVSDSFDAVSFTSPNTSKVSDTFVFIYNKPGKNHNILTNLFLFIIQRFECCYTHHQETALN